MPVLNAYSLKMMLPLCLVHCNGIRDRQVSSGIISDGCKRHVVCELRLVAYRDRQ